MDVFVTSSSWLSLIHSRISKMLRNFTLEDVSEKCKALASHIHQGTIGKMLLENECEKTEHNPKVIHQANDTRWDSRCQNMRDVVYHEECLLSLAAKGKLSVKKKGEPAYSLVPSQDD